MHARPRHMLTLLSSRQGLIIVTQPDYIPQPYQGYLFTVMVATFALLVNTFLAKYLPRLEGGVFVLFVVAFVATLATLWSRAPLLSASELHQGWDYLAHLCYTKPLMKRNRGGLHNFRGRARLGQSGVESTCQPKCYNVPHRW